MVVTQSGLSALQALEQQLFYRLAHWGERTCSRPRGWASQPHRGSSSVRRRGGCWGIAWKLEGAPRERWTSVTITPRFGQGAVLVDTVCSGPSLPPRSPAEGVAGPRSHLWRVQLSPEPGAQASPLRCAAQAGSVVPADLPPADIRLPRWQAETGHREDHPGRTTPVRLLPGPTANGGIASGEQWGGYGHGRRDGQKALVNLVQVTTALATKIRH